MKKTLFIFLLFTCYLTVRAQENFLSNTETKDRYKISGYGRIYYCNHDKISSKAASYIIKNHGDETTYRKFCSGRRIARTGSFLIKPSIVIGAFGLIGTLAGGKLSVGIPLIVIGTGFTVLNGYIIKGGNKKMSKAIDQYNNNIISGTNQKVDFSVGLNQNGVGFAIQF